MTFCPIRNTNNGNGPGDYCPELSLIGLKGWGYAEDNFGPVDRLLSCYYHCHSSKKPAPGWVIGLLWLSET